MRPILVTMLFFVSFVSAQPSRIELKSLYSSTLSTSKEFNILFPEGYDSESDRYPVVYLFRGAVDEWADPAEDGSRRGTIKTVVDSLYAKKKIGKMIYVMPGLGAPAPAAEYNYLVNDLIPYVDANFRTIPDRWHRMMDGFSLGGLITTNLLSTVPQLFSSIGSYDGTLSLFDNTRFSNASASLIYSIKQSQLLYHTGSVGATNNGNNLTTFSILNSKGIFNTLPSFVLNPNAQHNWYYADLHMSVSLPLHWQSTKNAVNSLSLSFTDSITGTTISGQPTIRWTNKSVPNSLKTFLLYSDDNGDQWNQIDSLSGNDSSATWNTTMLKDGTRYRLKILSAGDTLFGEGFTGRFTVNNPGNGAPDIEFSLLKEHDTLSGNYPLQWTAGDADGDAVTVGLEMSYNAGISWTSLASGLPNNGSYSIDTRQLANGKEILLRLACTDGLLSSSVTSPKCVLYNKRVQLLNAQFLHLTGNSDANMQAIGISAASVTAADYSITFKDSTDKKSYSVFDANGINVVSDATELDGRSEGPLFNGFRLLITDVPTPVVNVDSSRWIVGSSPLTAEVKLIDINLESGTVKALPFPSDYELRVSNSTADTSLSLFGAVSLPVPFSVWNNTLGKKTKFIFLELDGNGILSRNDELYLFEYDPSGGYQLTWHITLTGNENVPDPKPGDIYRIKVIKPLTAKDSYRFLYTPASVNVLSSSTPEQYSVSRNYPNPFNPTTAITFSLPKEEVVTITIFDILGRVVETPLHARVDAGTYSFSLNMNGHSSGVYFYRLSTEHFSQTQKMILTK